MKSVHQTITRPPRGNCFAACVASILELSLDEVPNFIEQDDWYGAAQQWLEPFNLHLVSWSSPGVGDAKGYMIIQVDSFHGDWGHVVVGLDGRIIFDPNPESAGKRHEDYQIKGYTMFVTLDPARPVVRPK